MKFKKILSAFLVLLLLFSTFSFTFVQAATIKGDANADGVVDMKDVLMLRRYYVGYNENIDKEAADYNNDSEVNISDILYVRKKLAGLEDSEDGIPVNYMNSLTSNVQVNQIGYDTDSEKTATLCEPTNTIKANTLISNVCCYVVDEENGDIVYSGISTVRTHDIITSRYVSTFDFSSVKKPGKYKIHTPYGYSYSFEIKDNPYKEVEDALITGLYYNRCGDENREDIVGEKLARDACHSGDTPVYILNKLDTNPESATYGKYIQSSVAKASDFLYGLHDAGDYGRYTTPATQVVADLLISYQMYGDTLDLSLIDNNISDILNEARHEMKWLLTMQNKETGGVYWRIATLKFCNYGDRADQDSVFESTGFYVSHETLKATSAFAGAAALSARVFKNIDPDFSAKCLKAAKDAYVYIKENMNDESAHVSFSNNSEYPAGDAGSYGDNSQAWGEIWWAACELFAATGEETYHNDVKDLYRKKNSAEINFSYTKIDAYNQAGPGSFSYILNPSADEAIKTELMTAFENEANSTVDIGSKDKYNVVLKNNGEYQWGSNQIICVKLKTLAMVDYINGTNDYESTIRDSICYILGRNAVNKSYITGYGSDSPKDICHGPSAYLRVNYGLYTPAPGLMVGGALGNGKNYEDNHDNYACNEICVYWNSSAILAFGYIVDFDTAK